MTTSTQLNVSSSDDDDGEHLIYTTSSDEDIENAPPPDDPPPDIDIDDEAHNAFIATLPAFTVKATTLDVFERATAALAFDYNEASALA